ncbi:MAG: hypothetical protein IPL35_08310 [Sphingobacteriales bacterium]|nr:hypothetical protein [Sphingobacteriales bacterium]
MHHFRLPAIVLSIFLSSFLLLFSACKNNSSTETTPDNTVLEEKKKETVTPTETTPAAETFGDSNSQQFRSATGAYMLRYPQNWKAEEHRKSKTATIHEPIRTDVPMGYPDNITVLFDKPAAQQYDAATNSMKEKSLDFEAYYNNYSRQLAEHVPDFKLIRQADTTLQGKKAKLLFYTFKAEEKSKFYPVINQAYIFFHNNQVFTFNCRSDISRAEAAQKIFQPILASLQWQ